MKRVEEMTEQTTYRCFVNIEETEIPMLELKEERRKQLLDSVSSPWCVEPVVSEFKMLQEKVCCESDSPQEDHNGTKEIQEEVACQTCMGAYLVTAELRMDQVSTQQCTGCKHKSVKAKIDRRNSRVNGTIVGSLVDVDVAAGSRRKPPTVIGHYETGRFWIDRRIRN